MKINYTAPIYLWVEIWGDRKVGLLQRARKLGLDYLEVSSGDDVFSMRR